MIAFGVLTASAAFAADPAQPSAREVIRQRAPNWIKAFNVTGAGIAWIEDGKAAWVDFYGEQIPAGPPANEKTLYNIASLTKPISAAVILRLASAGKLSLDESMFPLWVDADVARNEWSRKLTPRLCLIHESGFPNWRYLTGNTLKFQFEPGTAVGYSGEGYDYVARFAEKKMGRPWESLAQEYVFDPIGMQDTAYTPQSWWAGREAKPIESSSKRNWSAAALLRTTVRDYARFVVSEMEGRGLSASVREQRFKIGRNLTTPEQEAVLCEDSGNPVHHRVATGFALGWHVVELDGDVIVDHTGVDGDVMTFAFFVPSRKIGAVIFTNGPDVGHQLIDKVLAALYPDQVYLKTIWQ